MAFNPKEHMMDLKGKQYLQVMWRLVWFREEHPNWGIVTTLVSHDTERMTAVFAAKIIEPENERIVSCGYGSESARDFNDYLEKAETKAVGRALAMLGYGTQFAPELDEMEGKKGPRIADSPVAPQRIDAEDAEALERELVEAGVNVEKLLKQKQYRVKDVHDLTVPQAADIRRKLEDSRNSQVNRGNPAAGTA